MFNFKLLCLVIFLFELHQIRSQISDKRLCANENCTKPISLAKSLSKYISPSRGILSFQQNVDVTIYSKSAGSNMDLWGVEINGKRGYAPHRFLRETKVIIKDLPYLVDTELIDEQVPSKETKKEEIIAGDKVGGYDVVDGTTIYYPDENITPSTTENNIKPTVTINAKEENQEIQDQDINNKETEPLQVDQSIKSDIEDNKIENKEVNSNNSKDKIKEKKEGEESIVDNIYQSLQNWMNEIENPKEENDKVLLEDDEDYDEEEEEESDEDDDEDDDESEGKVEDADVHEIIDENIKVNLDDTIKSRQLLSEKEDSQKKEVSEQTMEATTETNKIDENVSNASECSGENCLKEKIEENQSETIKETEIVTEPSYKESAGFEIPLPQDYDVTPNPIQVDEASKEDVNKNKEIDNEQEEETNTTVETKERENLETSKEEENVKYENSNVNQINQNIQNAVVEESNQSTNLDNQNVNALKQPGLGNSNDQKVKESENRELEDTLNAETPNNHDESSTNVEQNLEQKLDTENQQLKGETQNEEPSSSINVEQNSEQKDLENQPINAETQNNHDESSSFINTEQNSEEKDLENQRVEVEGKINAETPPINNPDELPNINQEEETPSSQIPEETVGQNLPEIIETPTTDSQESIQDAQGVFSGIYTNWFDSSRQDKTEETPNQEQDILNNEVADSKTANRQEDDLNNEDAKIEKHDHSFISMITEERKVIAPEGPKNVEQDETVSDVIKEYEGDSIGDEIEEEKKNGDIYDPSLSKENIEGSCPADGCPTIDISAIEKQLEMEERLAENIELDYSDYFNLFTVLAVTGFSVVIFMLGYISIDKSRREGPLIARINTLEKALLVSTKENELLADKVNEIQNEAAYETDRISNEELEIMKKAYQELLTTKSVLEEQIQSLEKELENSTEVGLELNRMLQDILSSQNGSETLIANVEQLQRQLVEQQGTINSINDTVNLKDTENHELQLELEIKNKKVTHLQAELDKMALNLFKVEEDKEQMQAKLESEIIELKDQSEKNKNAFNSTRTKLLDEINALKSKYLEAQRNLDLKTNEYTILKDNFNQIQAIKNNTEALQSLLNASSMKAELQQLQRDNQTLNDVLRQEQQTKFTLEKQIEIALQEAQSYKEKYDESDKEKLEAQTKLEVLSNYFKEKEAQLQKELNKHESLWLEQQGEATSTVERIKYMQEELQNYKQQNESLKQEIVSQEVDLKSQISLLEKKAHENWVAARQADRRLEDAKQEAAQLRNRLTLKERSFIEDKSQNRIQSPLEQNGDVAISPLHMQVVESPASPPLLYGTRDHLTTSPPIPNLPPFLPPPPGVPFMPPPIPGGFMPPPPFSVDHRPPPLGRMSSPPPPLNSRYSPDSRYSPYDRNSPSPPYDDDYGPSSPPPPPPLHRGYSPYNSRDDRREYKRPPPPPGRTNGRNKGAMSSGSGNSNESLEKINRHSKV